MAAFAGWSNHVRQNDYETTQPIAPLFMAIVAFARRRGAPEPLFLQPGYWSQCFEHEGGEWCVVINGRDCIQYCEPQGTIGCNVWPYGAAVFRKRLARRQRRSAGRRVPGNDRRANHGGHRVASRGRLMGRPTPTEV